MKNKKDRYNKNLICKAQALKLQEKKKKHKEAQVKSQEFMRVTENLTDSAKQAEAKAYGIIGKLEDLEKGIANKENEDKDALDKYIKDIIYDLIKLSNLIESKDNISERNKLGYSTDEEFDVKFENTNKLKDKLKWLCSKARGHLGGNLYKVTVDGLTTEKVTKAIGIVKLIHKTLAYINDNSKGSLADILNDLEKEAEGI